ncbi:acetyltransferase [Leptolyngbya sp. Heron Island J]|nr:acetyltransferase [Leptolyngbya sp. Heron Island J]
MISLYSLRPATWDDFEFVFQLNKINMWKYVELVRVWSDEVERADMHRKFAPGRDQIVQIDGKAVGVFKVDYQESEICLNHIELLPEFQGKGVGTALMQKVLTEAESLNMPVTLYVLKINPAKQFYKHLGFQTVEEIASGKDCNGMERGVKCKMLAAANATTVGKAQLRQGVS